MNSAADIEKQIEPLNEDELIEGIGGQRPSLSPLAALKEFATRGSPRESEILSAVLDDASQLHASRRLATLGLGRVQTAENQGTLLRHLEIADARLLADVAQSLGRIGDEQALERLEATEVQEEGRARGAVEFARSLIAYRLRLNRNLIPAPLASELVEIDRERAVSFEVQKADPAVVAEVLEGVSPRLPGIQLADRGAVRIDCGASSYLLMLNHDFRTRRGLSTLRSRNAVPVVMLKEAHCPERYFLAHYLFTHPSESADELVLTVTRPRGDISHVGTVSVGSNAHRFSLRSVASRYTAAVEVEGSLDLAAFEFTFGTALSHTTVTAERLPAGVPREVAVKIG